jgi:hypothetical protein
MSKTLLAVTAFLLGAATSYLILFLWHTPVSAQGRVVPLAEHSGLGIPTVPPITQHYADFGPSQVHPVYEVDGAECVRCVFDSPILRYSGGNFGLTDFSFSGDLQVEFTGAARNTLLFLQFMQDLEAGRAPTQEPLKVSIVKAIPLKGRIKGSIRITQ